MSGRRAIPPDPDPDLIHWQGHPQLDRFGAWMFCSGIFLGFWIGFVIARFL